MLVLNINHMKTYNNQIASTKVIIVSCIAFAILIVWMLSVGNVAGFNTIGF